jgi:Flp pilus assembly protein TadG
MQTIGKTWRAIRSSTIDFLLDGRGLAATEFAMIVPLMLVMFFGTVEFSSAVAIDRKLTLVARTLSDLVSQSGQTTVDDTYLQNAFTASISIMTPYPATPVKATISEIYVSSKKVATVQWSKAATIANGASQAALGSSTRKSGDTVTTLIPSDLLIPQTYLILSEVSYLYTPTVGYVLKSGVTLSDISYTRPRQYVCIVYNSTPSTSCPTP